MVTSAARAGSPVRAPAFPHWLPAVGIAALSWAATLVGLGILAATDVWALPVLDDVPVDATVGLAFPLVGAVILVGTRPGARAARLTAWLLLGAGSASGAGVLATAIAATATTSHGGVDAAVVLQSWLWVPGSVPLLTLLPLSYPDGLLPGRRWRLAAAAGAASTVLLAVGVALFPEDVVGRVRLEKPWSSSAAAVVFAVPGALLLVASVAAALVGLVVRLRRADGLRRRQVAVFLTAAGVVVVDALLQPVLPTPVGAVSQAIAFALLPIAIGVAITRDRLYALDLVVARALVAISLAACLAGLYLTLFALLRGLGPSGTWAAAGAAGATGLLVQPLALRLTKEVDRLFYGDRADPFAVLARISGRLQVGTDALAVPQVVCDTVVESLRLRSAALSVSVEDGATGAQRTVASAGTGGAGSESFDLRYSGEVLGRLVVAPREGEARLGPRDRDLLTALADHIAPALSAVRLSEALRRSRESLVTAREEERRRLRRDLHDGLGAALAGVRLQLESARELVPEPRAGRLIEAATSGVTEAVADVRRVTEDLRPPALDDLGLQGSLEALAGRFDTPTLPVTTHFACTGGPWPAAVEVACFRIAAEALSNAVRHSRARAVCLELTQSDAALVLTVVDDGTAVRTSRPGGLGLSSMRLRAEEIGGRCVVELTPTGTTVTATLPVRAA